MQTALYNIKFKDGREFNIICANYKQNKDILLFYSKMSHKIEKFEIITKGILTMGQFKKHNSYDTTRKSI